jgi:hypothetical protein
MSETKIEKIEKKDIHAPRLNIGSSAIVFQRHEKYERNPESDIAGSLIPDVIDEAKARDKEFFDDLLSEDDGSDTMVLFVSSDTQYANNGYRSMETAQIAQDAAVEAMEELGIDPSINIINFNPDFKTDRFDATNQSVRPDKNIREPQIFESMDYVKYLKTKYGSDDALSPQAWGIHEMDGEKEKREEFGAESVYDMADRTKKSLSILGRYAKVFHAHNPDKKLIIWAASHYDTISPFVKQSTNTGFDQYVPVDYGAGIVIELAKDKEPSFEAQGKRVVVNLGNVATKSNL